MLAANSRAKMSDRSSNRWGTFWPEWEPILNHAECPQHLKVAQKVGDLEYVPGAPLPWGEDEPVHPSLLDSAARSSSPADQNTGGSSGMISMVRELMPALMMAKELGNRIASSSGVEEEPSSNVENDWCALRRFITVCELPDTISKIVRKLWLHKDERVMHIFLAAKTVVDYPGDESKKMFEEDCDLFADDA